MLVLYLSTHDSSFDFDRSVIVGAQISVLMSFTIICVQTLLNRLPSDLLEVAILHTWPLLILLLTREKIMKRTTSNWQG